MKTISGKSARRLVEREGAMLCDARDPVSFRNGSLPGAKNYPIRLISTLLSVNKKTPLVFFGNSNDDTDMTMGAKYAEVLGFTNVYLLGAITNWQR